MKQRTKISFNKPDFEEKIVKSLETIAVVDSVYPCDSQTKPGLQLGVRVNVGSFFFYYSELRGMDKTSHPLNWRSSDDLVGFSKQQTRNLLKILASRKTMLYTCSIKNELAEPARFLWNVNEGIDCRIFPSPSFFHVLRKT
jgi:hypothetical protein